MIENELNRKSLHLLYEDFHVPLFNFAMRWIFNETLAEELVHEAFMRIWKKKNDVDLSRVKSLLFKTLQNLCINHLRREKIWETIQNLDPLSTIVMENQETRVIIDQEVLALKEKMEKIPLKYRKVLLLFYYGNFSYEDIANLLEISEGTVASRKSRGLKILKSKISPELEYA